MINSPAEGPLQAEPRAGSSPAPGRLPIVMAMGAAVGIFCGVAAATFAGGLRAAALVALVAAAGAAILFWRRPPFAVEARGGSRGLTIVAGVATLLALAQVGRVAVYMVDAGRTGSSILPSSPWMVQHSCLSSYFVAARSVAAGVPNVYADELYRLPPDHPGGLGPPRKLGTFNVDVFEYPPPFLLVPRALLAVAPSFLRFRMLWFALDGGIILLALVVVARRLGPAAGRRALLLSALVWAALPTLTTLQIGNFQPVVIALAMLAMIQFERRRWAAGGLLLAYATVSKLFPGVLIVYLAVRRQWRALAWTVASSVGLTLLTLAVTGWLPFGAFREHLPRLLGGESFPGLQRPAPIGINDSIPGLVLKLRVLGVPGMSFALAKAVGWIYSVLLLAVTVVLGRRSVPEERRPQVWLVLLVAATLRSPFLPQDYAVFAPLWLLTLMAAATAPGGRALGAVVLAWAALNILVPIDATVSPAVRIAIATVPQVVVLILTVRGLRPPAASLQPALRDYRDPVAAVS